MRRKAEEIRMKRRCRRSRMRRKAEKNQNEKESRRNQNEKEIKIFIYRRPTLYPLEIAVDFLKSL